MGLHVRFGAEGGGMSCCDDDESTARLVEEVDDTNTILQRFRQRPAPADFGLRLRLALADEARRRSSSDAG